MAEKDELNDLLGDSDEEADSPTNDNNNNDNNKLQEDQPRISDLLGDSDEEEDDFAEKDAVAMEAQESQESRTKDLDHILGASITPAGQEVRVKTSSVLSIPETFEIPTTDTSFFVRTPNFIKIQPQPFDLGTHSREAETAQLGATTAVVRWRLKRDALGQVVLDAAGQPVRESNARLLRWEDGSYQLVVGDAVFTSKVVAADSCYVYEQQKSEVAAEFDEFAEEAAAPRSETCLECVGAVDKRIILQPTSISSETHTKMSLKISETFKKEQKISIRDYEKITENPEKTLRDLARREEEQNKRDLKLRQQSEYRGGGFAPTRSSQGSKRPSMSADYLNDDTQFEGENLAQLKKSVREQRREPAARPAKVARKFRDEDEDEEEEDDDEEEGEDLDEEDEEEEEEDEGVDSEEEAEVRAMAQKKLARDSRKREADREEESRPEKRKEIEAPQQPAAADEESLYMLQQRKRAKRVIDSDEDEE